MRIPSNVSAFWKRYIGNRGEELASSILRRLPRNRAYVLTHFELFPRPPTASQVSQHRESANQRFQGEGWIP